MMDKVCVIHWWVKDRQKLEMTTMEDYHFKKFNKYDFKNKFDKYIICIAIDNLNNNKLINWAKNMMNETLSGPGSVDTNKIEINILQNRKEYGEFETYSKYVLPRLKNDEYLFYMHIKGVSREGNPIRCIRELKWCEKIYNGIFDENICFNDKWPIAGSRIRTKDTPFCSDMRMWFDKWFWLNKRRKFEFKYPFMKHFNNIGMNGFLDGSFQMINTKLMREYIERNNTNIDNIIGMDFSGLRITHLSEYFLCSLMEIDCIGYKYKDGSEE